MGQNFIQIEPYVAVPMLPARLQAVKQIYAKSELVALRHRLDERVHRFVRYILAARNRVDFKGARILALRFNRLGEFFRRLFRRGLSAAPFDNPAVAANRNEIAEIILLLQKDVPGRLGAHREPAEPARGARRFELFVSRLPRKRTVFLLDGRHEIARQFLGEIPR